MLLKNNKQKSAEIFRDLDVLRFISAQIVQVVFIVILLVFKYFLLKVSVSVGQIIQDFSIMLALMCINAGYAYQRVKPENFRTHILKIYIHLAPILFTITYGIFFVNGILWNEWVYYLMALLIVVVLTLIVCIRWISYDKIEKISNIDDGILEGASISKQAIEKNIQAQ